MAGTFELKKANATEFTFNLKAANGEVILTGETYVTKQGAERGIAAVRTNAPLDARYQKKSSVRGEPYFLLEAGNGETLGRSEMYATPAARESGIASVKENGPGAVVRDLT